ncbi:hypothetical protein [Legionella bozemanae]|uniref:VPS9 domain-containing protein n=1 Tax=Legionella bozemanae TaxID=447 RepID=A0A0W0S254_LEGBO|nr:hypothetical protein [Legionella bozemanae]KTC77241.1 hypothetical protein Lboz_0194 [Legionella bozemanae]STO32855.1 Uncharacterised protein [Legionella bozemanae]
MPKPQDYIDAIRKGKYLLALGLGQLVYDRYMPLNNDEILGGDDVTPLMASLLAETDLTFNDIVKIQHGIFSLNAHETAEQQYYLTQIMSAVSTLLSHEAWLMQQEGNQGKSPQEIRQMVRDEIAQAIARPVNPKKEAAKEVARTTIIDKSPEMEILIEKEKSCQKVFAYAVDHLIKRNVEQIRDMGKLLSDYLDSIEADIKAIDQETKRLEAEQLEPGGERQARIKELEKSRREIWNRKLEVEDQLSLLSRPETHGQISAQSVKTALEGVPVEESFQSIHQQITSYLDFLENNRPHKHSILLKAYEARKIAAENMLIAVTTSNLRTPDETLAYLENNIKAIENNRPGLLELGFIAWVKNFFKNYKAEMIKKTDNTLAATNTELKTFKENFVEHKKALGMIMEEHRAEEDFKGPKSEF